MIAHSYDKSHEIKMNIYAIILGIVASLTGYVFRSLVEMMDEFFYGKENSVFTSISDLNPVLRFFILVSIPAGFGALVGLGVWKISVEAKGHGIPNVMQAMHVEHGVIRARVPIAKFFLSILTIGSGNSAGAEGPIAQIGSGLGSFLGRRFNLRKNDINILIATGAASGIAAVFNAPLGGALFGIEILLSSIALRSVIPVIVGTATSIATNNILLDKYNAVFQIPAYTINHPVEYIFLIILGIIIAFVGIFWQRTLIYFEKIFDEWNILFYLKTALGGLLVGIILFFSTFELRGSSYKLIQLSLEGESYLSKSSGELWSLIPLLMFFVLMKILITALTLGSGQSGGVFSPSLLMGALTGVTFGIVLYLIFPDLGINPGLYAIFGMAALFGGIARAPLTMVILTTEMSGEYNLFPALMLIIAVSYLLHNYILDESIYTESLTKFGLSTRFRTTDDLLNYIPVIDVMANEVVCIYENISVSLLSDIFISYHHLGYLVVDKEHHLKGIVTLTDLRKSKLKDHTEALVSDIMTSNIITISPETSVKDAIDKMFVNGIGRLPVIIEKDGKVVPVGFFTRSDIVKTLESLQRLNQIEYEKKMDEFQKKITEPLIKILPSKYPGMSDSVITIKYDWIAAYTKKKNDEN